MPGTAIDTSVIIAGLLAWHNDHERAVNCLEELLDSEDGIILPAPVIVEAYSVLTRLPPPHRVSAHDAFLLLDHSFRGAARVSQLSPRDIWGFVQAVSEAGTAGGQTYDAQILACAQKAGAEKIATLNVAHFERLAPPDIEVVIP